MASTDKYKLIFEINGFWTCNFHCPECTARLQEPPAKEKEIEKKVSYESHKNIILDFLNKYPDGEIYIHGGEPLYYFEKFISIVSDIRRNHPANLISTISNCSILEKEQNLEKFLATGISRLVCSINSHIPEVHNITRGLPKENKNSQFIMSLPEKIKDKLHLEVSAVPFEENIDHLKEFTKIIYDLGFESIAFCFYEPAKQSKNLGKFIKFYSWLQAQSGPFRKFIGNPDEFIEETIKWYLTGKVSPFFKCRASIYNTFVSYDQKMFSCVGLFGYHRKQPYQPNDISNTSSNYNLLIKPLPDYCHYQCLLNSCYF
jgi:MoaA/NifB/PqqE/SkfB family radical SAM enzyme